MTRAFRTTRRALTLLELLVVISILLLLLGLFIGVGVNVTRNQKASQTRGVLEALNRALDEYMIANSNNLPRFDATLYAGVPGYDGPNADPAGPNAYLASHASSEPQMPQRPDASVFIRQARGIGDVDSILNQIPERFLILTTAPPSAAPAAPLVLRQNMLNTAPSVIDAWSDPEWRDMRGDTTMAGMMVAWPIREQSLIYYVHPNNRRDRTGSPNEFPDAQELYGACVNGRPYFLSAGPDGFYGHPSEISEIETHYDMTARDGESPVDYFNRVLRQARLDNLYSAPVDIDFRVSIDVISEFPQP